MIFKSHAEQIEYIMELVENVKDEMIKNELLEYLNSLLSMELCGDPYEFEEDKTGIEFEALTWNKDKLYFIEEMVEDEVNDIEEITDEELIDILNEIKIGEDYKVEYSTYDCQLQKNIYQHTIAYKLIDKYQIIEEVEDGIKKNVVYFQVKELSDKDTLVNKNKVRK